jgi:hypothetical protein
MAARTSGAFWFDFAKTVAVTSLYVWGTLLFVALIDVALKGYFRVSPIGVLYVAVLAPAFIALVPFVITGAVRLCAWFLKLIR